MADSDREQEGGDAGNLGGGAGNHGGDGGNVEADGAGNNDDNTNGNDINRAPSPVGRRDEVGGRVERVERTPLDVIMESRDDPFPEEQQDGIDDDGHDSVTSDDENNLVTFPDPQDPALSGMILMDLVVKYKRYRLRNLTVTFDEEELLEPNELPGDFLRFVRALDHYDRIKELHLTRGNFGRDDPDVGGVVEDAQEGDGHDGNEELGRDLSRIVGEAYVEELFGTVLCQHYSLCDITFSKSSIPTRYWKLFTEGFDPIERGDTYLDLSIHSTTLTTEGCQLLKRMCQRKVRVSKLSLVDCGLGEEEWRTVCEGIAESCGETNHVILVEDNVTVEPDTLLPLLRAPAGVELLRVRAAHWAEGAFEGFARELRTDETLLELGLNNVRDVHRLRLVEELLTTYNCTLEEFSSDPTSDHASLRRIHALLARNKRTRSLYKPERSTLFERYHASRKAERYHLSQLSKWSRVLAEYGRLPTQLYRFVRHGNLESFASQVKDVSATASAAAAAAAVAPVVDSPHVTKKRRRKLYS